MSTDRQEVTLLFSPFTYTHTHMYICIYIYKGIKIIVSVLPGRTFSRDDGNAPDAPEAGALCRSSDPLSGRSDSRVIVLCFRAPTAARERDGRLVDPPLVMRDAAKQLAVPLRETVKQEREPSLGPPSPSPGSFASPLSAPGLTGTPQPLSWPRNINLVPFRWSVRRPPRERRGMIC